MPNIDHFRILIVIRECRELTKIAGYGPSYILSKQHLIIDPPEAMASHQRPAWGITNKCNVNFMKVVGCKRQEFKKLELKIFWINFAHWNQH